MGSASLQRWLQPATLLLPGMLCVALGLALLAGDEGTLDTAAAGFAGLGSGMCQTASFIAMLETETVGATSVAALWNVALDGGIGLGSLVLVPLAVASSYHITFVVMAGLVIVGAGLLWLLNAPSTHTCDATTEANGT